MLMDKILSSQITKELIINLLTNFIKKVRLSGENN